MNKRFEELPETYDLVKAKPLKLTVPSRLISSEELACSDLLKRYGSGTEIVVFRWDGAPFQWAARSF